MSRAAAHLTLVPTPIGNLGDITFRAVEALKAADVVAAEDTRHSRVLLEHYGIGTPLTRLDVHTIAARGPGLLERHANVAYVTDAGSPGISDPGAELVRLAIQLGLRVEALPGPTAVIPAVVLSGLPTARFTFEGFLPRKGGERTRRVNGIAAASATSVVYEAPQRLAATLADLARACGAERQASVSRELTKLHEETVRGSLGDLNVRFSAKEPKGEIVIVVGPAPDSDPADSAPAALQATALADAGVRGRLLRDALLALGVPRNEAYRLALDHPEDDSSTE
ncbi:MAG TPA: 16S rRNA (cytidine(1402)-2'-O)-methyltransferase [Trueperaceae bacterium]|nr:16S rRNA (cytidine(1402)-2'-O)-methyltransferase [Trueperaceae bacterium]